MKSVVIGASAGLGRALAETLAARGDDLFLVASDARDLEAMQADFRLRHGINVGCLAVDLGTVGAEAFRDAALADGKPIDNLFCVAGWGDPERDQGPVPPALAERIVAVNFRAPLAIVNALLADLAGREGANIVGIGSAATIRGRRRNSVYASSKTGLRFYFSCLRHYLADRPCRVQFYNVGFMATRLAGDQQSFLPFADPAAIAAKIVAGLGRDRETYLPGWWALIALVLRLLPWPIFKRLNI